MGPGSTSRSTEPNPSEEGQGLVVGFIHAPHGLDGELRVESRTDVPERFKIGASLHCEGVGALTIAASRVGPKGPLIRFKGISSRDAADRLRGRRLTVSKDEARRAAADSFLWADLVGLRAESESGDSIGTVRDVLRAGETDVLVITLSAGGELLLPTIESVVRRIDLSAGVVVVKPQEELT